jgi:hypothetical protein
MIPETIVPPMIKPPDATMSFQSFGRRYRDLLEAVPLDRRDLITERTGSHGSTALDLLTSAAHDLTELEQVLRQILHQDNVELTTDPLRHDPNVEPYLGLKEALNRVERRSDALATLSEQATSSLRDWERTAKVGSASVSAWDVAKQAVGVASHRLRLIEELLGGI